VGAATHKTEKTCCNGQLLTLQGREVKTTPRPNDAGFSSHIHPPPNEVAFTPIFASQREFFLPHRRAVKALQANHHAQRTWVFESHSTTTF